MKKRVKLLLGILTLILFINIVLEPNSKKEITIQTNKYYQPNLEIVSGDYYLKNTIIKRIPLRKSKTEFITNFKATAGKLNLKCEQNNYIGTGCLIELNSDNINDNYTLIVEGDVTGDGNNTIIDIVKMNNHYVQKNKLTGIYFEAADINNDNKITQDDLTINGDHLLSQKELPTINYENEKEEDNAEIKLSTTSIKLNRGNNKKIEATIDSDTVTILNYKSQDSKIATVDSNGVITALKEGTTQITIVASNGRKATLNVEVYVEPTGVLINPENLTLTLGSKEKLKAIISPADATNKNVNWSITDSNIATIDSEGNVIAKNIGITTITVTTSNNKTASITLEVKPILSELIVISPNEVTIELDENKQLAATILPENTTDKTIKWTSSDEKIATVDESGIVTPVSIGTTIITATTSNNKTATATIKVKPILSESISLDIKELEIKIGSTKQITATVLPENTTDKTVIWTSSNPNIAIVDENGLLSAIAVGKTTITAATTNNKKAIIEVEVKPILSESVTITPNDVSIDINETKQLTATILPENTTDKTIQWKSSNEKIATVDKNGLVTAISIGTTTITATTSNGKTATSTIEVKPILSESVTITPNDVSININETKQLTATILPENTTDKTVQWKSSDEKIAIVDKNGLIKAIGVGTATITATTTNNKISTATIEVKPILSESVTISPSKTSMYIQETKQLSVVVLPTTTTNKTVTWKSSNNNIVRVDSSGKIIAVSVGSATITATTSNGKTATSTIEVKPILSESITISPTIANTTINNTIKLNTIILPANTTDKKVTWKSSDEKIATVDQSGVVKTLSVGKVTITAITTNNKIATATINVLPVLSESISLSPKEVSLELGLTKQLTATILPENTTDKTIKWLTNNSNVARVDQNGLVTTVGVGTATITAITTNNKVATTVVEVKPILSQSIAIIPNEFSITIGLTKQLTASISPLNTTDKTITWKSDDESIVTVDANGLVKTVGVGSTTITATTSNGKTATSKVVVMPILTTSITISPLSSTLSIDKTRQFTATVYPEEAADKSITWTSSDPTIASVDENGLVTTHKLGTAIITATTNDTKISASATMNVALKTNRGDSIRAFDQCRDNGEVIKSITDKNGNNVDIVECLEGYKLDNKGLMMQDFAVTDDYIYFSFLRRGTWVKTEAEYNELGPTGSLKKTSANYILRINKSNNTYMMNYVEYAGHAQSFDVTNGTERIYLNYFAKLYNSSSYGYGSRYVGLTSIKFEDNLKKAGKEVIPLKSISVNHDGTSISVLHSDEYITNNNLDKDSYYNEVISIGRSTGKMLNPELAVDEKTSRLVLVNGTNAYLYDLNSFMSGSAQIIKTITLATSSRQGVEIANGYLYLWSGTDTFYLRKYSLSTGNLVNQITFNLSNYYKDSAEGEGISVHNGNVYIGVSSNAKNCNEIFLVRNF